MWFYGKLLNSASLVSVQTSDPRHTYFPCQLPLMTHHWLFLVMQPALWPWFDQWIFREEVFSQGSNIWRRREHLNDLCIDAKGLFYQQCHESGNGTYRSWETGLKTFVTEMSSGGSDKKAPLDQQVRWLSCQPRQSRGNDGNAGNVKEAKQKKEKN